MKELSKREVTRVLKEIECDIKDNNPDISNKETRFFSRFLLKSHKICKGTPKKILKL